MDLMDFAVSGLGEVVAPARPAEWAPLEPRLAQGDAHNFETGCWVVQERLWRWEEGEFNFLIEPFYLIRDKIYDRDYREWEENEVKNAFLQIWNATPFPKEKTREAVRGPSFVHSTLPDRDAQAELAAALEEGMVAAAKQASLEIQAEALPKVDSWLKSTVLCGPTICPVPAGHGMYCPNDCSCCTHRDSELHALKAQIQLIVDSLGVKNIFKTHMRSEGASSVEKRLSHRRKQRKFFPRPLRWTLKPPTLG